MLWPTSRDTPHTHTHTEYNRGNEHLILICSLSLCPQPQGQEVKTPRLEGGPECRQTGGGANDTNNKQDSAKHPLRDGSIPTLMGEVKVVQGNKQASWS